MTEEKPSVTLPSSKPLRIVIDFWATSLHGSEVGVYEMERKRQKDLQWTKDADIIGKVTLNGEDFGRLVIRAAPWETDDMRKKRLVLKLFTMSDYWRGSLELLRPESLTITSMTEQTCYVHACLTKDSKQVARIHKVPRWPQVHGDWLGITYVDEQKTNHSFIFDSDRVSIGSDWTIKDPTGEKIGKIDGKLLDVGGRFEIKLNIPPSLSTPAFHTTLTLAIAGLKFHDDLKKLISTLTDTIKKTNEPLILAETEADLYKNPRLLRY
jgi:hypothetical protein